MHVVRDFDRVLQHLFLIRWNRDDRLWQFNPGSVRTRQVPRVGKTGGSGVLESVISKFKSGLFRCVRHVLDFNRLLVCRARGGIMILCK